MNIEQENRTDERSKIKKNMSKILKVEFCYKEMNQTGFIAFTKVMSIIDKRCVTSVSPSPNCLTY